MTVFIGWQGGKIENLNNQLSVSQLLNRVTQSAITLHYQVSLDNIKAKQLEDSEHVKVKTVIKTVLKDNECANTDFSDDLTNELRKYERDLRARAASTDTGSLNRWLWATRYTGKHEVGRLACIANGCDELNSKVQLGQESNTGNWTTTTGDEIKKSPHRVGLKDVAYTNEYHFKHSRHFKVCKIISKYF
ncbi:hypothetical protein QS817_18870 [Providencia rettgeri]|nr:hypothetical protein [Providencia rettgeri]MDL9985194.1 hypothetical protein [Providencia rettgeri]